MLSFKEKKIFYGCGVDEELIERFDSFINSDTNPMSMIFSEEEFKIISQLPLEKQAVSYAASFCCKESLFKASESPYNFNEISFIYLENEKKCKVCWKSELFSDEGLIIQNIENKISIFNNINCTAQLFLTAQFKDS